ncbi:MAG: thioredoxin domain-containing protein, partial [Pseudonocardiaceae bacterium]|nr:thioredoxin domain-containing protein [Pseudonocardiaceae bacterium]
MGGAERAERKRKQQAFEAAAREREDVTPDRGRGRIATAAAAVLVLLAVVVGVGVWLQQRDDPGELPAAIPATTPAADYPVELQGETVVAGDPGAPVPVDVYEDFLCPGCAALENLYGDRLAQAAASGQAVVRYHPIAMLDEDSDPEGYSTLAAGAAICAAE